MVLINIRRMLGIAKSSGFRPLAGIMVLIQTVLIDGLIAGRLVSVPLRGLWFLSSFSLLPNGFPASCFRPLTGIMVLITTITN